VKVSRHRSLNVCKGVIRNRDIALCETAEILAELKSQGVVDAFVVTVPDGETRRRTNTVILTFDMTHPPKFIFAGYLRIPIQIYIPNPLRCFKCQKFGHGKSTCKGQETCARCGALGHNSDGCHEQEKCTNCKGPHSSFSKQCPRWNFEKRVQQKRAENNISFQEARKMIATDEANKAVRTFTSVAAAPRPSVATTSTCSVETQTEITWPSSASEPQILKTVQVKTTQSTCAVQTMTTELCQPSPCCRSDVTNSEQTSSKNAQNKSNRPKLVRPPAPSEPPIPQQNRYSGLDSNVMDDGGE